MALPDAPGAIDCASVLAGLEPRSNGQGSGFRGNCIVAIRVLAEFLALRAFRLRVY